jgi:hypothetical protein
MKDFEINNFNKINKIKYWRTDRFVERAMKAVNEIEGIKVERNKSEDKGYKLFGFINIKQEHIDLIDKLVYNNINGLDGIVKDHKL